MKKIFYEKIGRKYIPIREYDSDFMDAFSQGTHIVMSYPGGQSRKYDIDPAYGPMIAAGRYANDAICAAISNASKLKPSSTPITPAQQKAWRTLDKAFGVNMYALQGASIHDMVEAGITAMQDEANKLMKHKSVRHAYDQFLLMCELTKETEK